MTAFVVMILSFVFMGTILGVLVVATFEDTKTYKAIDERIAKRIKKDKKDGEDE